MKLSIPLSIATETGSTQEAPALPAKRQVYNQNDMSTDVLPARQGGELMKLECANYEDMSKHNKTPRKAGCFIICTTYKLSGYFFAA
jgi:hypothetical protein